MNFTLSYTPDYSIEIDQHGGIGNLSTSGRSRSVTSNRYPTGLVHSVGNDFLFRFLLLLAMTNLAFATGCGKGHPPTYPVNGTVVFTDGTPLTTGGVVLSDSIVDGDPSINARGAIHQDGTFALSTFAHEDGVIAGKHRVLVRAKRDVDDFVVRGIIPLPVIAKRFERYETSGFEFTVADENNQWRLLVDRPRAR